MKLKIFLLIAFCLTFTACGSNSSSLVLLAPGSPTGVSVSAGSTAGTAIVSFSAPASSGSSAITGYKVTASPGNITATGNSSPITVTGLTPQTAYTFSVVATNSAGNSAAAATNPLSFYDVVETFYEPMTQPNNSIFTGTFTFDATSKTVSNLTGTLTEAMTMVAGSMTTVSLVHQLDSTAAAPGGVDGLLVTTFLNNNTNTLSSSATLTGTNGWEPGKGSGMHYGMVTMMTGSANPGNAYAMIFVNTTDPTTALAQAQIDKLAYADCTPTAPGGMMMGGGMMGNMCMTGTTVAGYGTLGTMNGYPSSQVITKR